MLLLRQTVNPLSQMRPVGSRSLSLWDSIPGMGTKGVHESWTDGGCRFLGVIPGVSIGFLFFRFRVGSLKRGKPEIRQDILHLPVVTADLLKAWQDFPV